MTRHTIKTVAYFINLTAALAITTAILTPSSASARTSMNDGTDSKVTDSDKKAIASNVTEGISDTRDSTSASSSTATVSNSTKDGTHPGFPLLSKKTRHTIPTLEGQLSQHSTVYAAPGKRESKQSNSGLACEKCGNHKRLKISGDFRYRHESIGLEGSDFRNRHRIRARISLKARVNSQMNVHVRIATGGADPISTNQTLDTGFSTKTLGLDRAYAVWQLNPPARTKLRLFLGKMKMPWYRPGKEELVWDDDLNPEGMAFTYRIRLRAVKFFASGGMMWAEERSSDEDSRLLAAQAGLKVRLSDSVRLLGGGSLFYYTAMKGYHPLYRKDDGAGNTTDDASGLYTTDFHLAEGFAELKIKSPLNVRIYGDFVMNTATSSNNTAWLAGIRLRWHDFSLRYNYRVLHANALVGAFSDSDFIGGGTDGQGHEFGAAWHPVDRSKVSVTWFEDEKGLDSPTGYRRIQVDFSVKF